jgi:hypothetical protein
MFEKMEQSAGDTLGYKIAGTIDKSAYDSLRSEVESLIDEKDKIKLLFDLTDFKWEKISAWGEDLKFGKSIRHNVSKMAIVGDKRWEKWLTKLAEPFYAEEAQYFEASEREAAWTWLDEDD